MAAVTFPAFGGLPLRRAGSAPLAGEGGAPGVTVLLRPQVTAMLAGASDGTRFKRLVEDKEWLRCG